MTTDGKSIFAGISDKNYINKFPGPATPGVYSLDAKTGSLNWKFEPQDRCEGLGGACDRGISAALSSTNDIIIAAGMDGWMYILDNTSGKLLWEFNTNVDFSEYTDIKAYGGTIEGLGPVIAGSNLFMNSGYQYGGNMAGNVLLNFELLD
jgi:polyvinyl alcohol dehydrogenase (cytochrome)